jgi:hypothetical protein
MTSTFEIHAGLAPVETTEKIRPGQSAPAAPAPLAVSPAETLLVTVDGTSGELRKTENSSQAVAAFRTVRRGRMGNALAMLALGEDILVNGLPALPLAVLAPKDSITLGPGSLCYITERIKPFVGQPSGDLLKQKCPFCRLLTDASTRIVTCQCGAAYHWETADSHPQTPENDRLRCFEKIHNCLSCGRQLSKEETLIWDPATL